jgi:hypothetical protein
MLARIVSKRITLLCKNRAAFGSSHDHHDHHDHHDYHVEINKNKPWVKFNSTRPIIQDPRFVSIYGVQETNYTLQPQLNDDPYEHIRDKPFFSFERLVYNDPWFHEDSHEPYNSPPRRGYIVGDDPLESRFMLSYAMYIAAGISLLVVGLYALGDKDLKNSEASLYDTYISSKYVHETLEAKNKRLNELRAKENALLRASSGAKKEVSAEKE